MPHLVFVTLMFVIVSEAKDLCNPFHGRINLFRSGRMDRWFAHGMARTS